MLKKCLSMIVFFSMVLSFSIISPNNKIVATGALYPNSCVTSLNAWQSYSSQTAFPGTGNGGYFPAFIGSGILGITIDSSGNQMMNLNLSSPWPASVTSANCKDMYIFSNSMYSKFFNNDAVQTVNPMPMGYMSWWLSVDGTTVDYASLPSQASNYSQLMDARNGLVDTAFTILNKVQMKIKCFIPQGTVTPVFQYSFSSTDGSTHNIVFKAGVNIKNRASGDIAPTVVGNYNTGNVIYTKREAIANTAALYYPLENYFMTYGLSPQPGKTYTVSMESQYIGVNYDSVTVPSSGSTTYDIMYYLGSNKTSTNEDAATQAAMNSWQSSSYSVYLTNHQNEWLAFYDETADVNFGDGAGTYQYEKEFLYHFSQYLDRAGQPQTTAAGAYLSYMMFHQPWWQGATFWDTNFLIDARLRSGNITAAKNLIQWLYSVKAASGRPFEWQIIDNGTRVGGTSTTWYADALYAVSAAKVYQATRDATFLNSYAWPIIKQFAEWAASNCFDTAGGLYKLKYSRVDVGDATQYYNDGYNAICIAAAMKQAVAIANSQSLALNANVNTVVSNLSLPQGFSTDAGRAIYKGADKYIPGGSSTVYPIDSAWNGVGRVTAALSLTEFANGNNSIVNQSLFDSTVGLDGTSHWYASQTANDTYQPWLLCWQAASLRRQDRPNDSWECIQKLLNNRANYIYGPGYLSEISPAVSNQVFGLPPYVTGEASYASAILETFVTSNLWDSNVGIFTNLHLAIQGQSLSCNRIFTDNGLKVDASYSPTSVSATLCNATSNNGISRTITIKMPYNVTDANITVKRDGATLTKGTQWTQVGRNVQITGVTVGGSTTTFSIHGTAITSGAPATPAISSINKGTSMSINWNTVGGALSYQVLRSSTSGGTYSVIATVNDSSYADTSIAVNTNYYYKITAVGAYSNSTSSYYGPVRSNFGYGFDGDTIDQVPNTSLWSIDAGNFLVKSDSVQGKIMQSGNSGKVYSIASGGDTNWTNYTATMKFVFAVNDAARSASLMFRYSNNTNFYRAIILPTQVGIQYCVGGTWGNPALVNFTCTVGKYYYVKTYANGNNQYMKIWADGDTEPASWMISTAYTSLASGKIACSSDGTIASFDNIIVLQD